MPANLKLIATASLIVTAFWQPCVAQEESDMRTKHSSLPKWHNNEDCIYLSLRVAYDVNFNSFDWIGVKDKYSKELKTYVEAHKIVQGGPGPQDDQNEMGYYLTVSNTLHLPEGQVKSSLQNTRGLLFMVREMAKIMDDSGSGCVLTYSFDPDSYRTPSMDLGLKAKMLKSIEDNWEKIDNLTLSPPDQSFTSEQFAGSPVATGETASKWIVGEKVNIRSCPSTSCGKTGWVADGSKVTVYEEKLGWTRISEYIDAQCISGESALIDSGDNSCSRENGVTANKLARWVKSEFLASSKPVIVDEPDDCGGLDLTGSDNYRTHNVAFCKASAELIQSGQCSADNLQEWGWSMSTQRGKDIYFTYCGEANVSNRLYLNVKNGLISR